MPNLRIRKLANFRLFACLFLSAVLAPAICAQVSRQLEVEVGPNKNKEVRILVSHVSYGEVLRTLQRKLGWEIELPPLADELKLSYLRIETTQPQDALAKLLEGSGLGYAFLGGVNGSPSMKVIVTPSTPREAGSTQETAASSANPDNGAAGALLPLPAQAQVGTTSQPNAAAAETMPKVPLEPSTLTLADAINAIGVPPGVSPADVGKAMTIPISDAAKIMGVPPGVSPAAVGKTITLPLPTGPGQHP